MADSGEIGEVTEVNSEARFQWRIPNFSMMPKEVDSCFTSPYFPLSDTSWYLAVYPNGLRKHESEGWIGLYLHRGDSGNPHRIHYTLGIKRADGGEEDVYAESVRIHIRGSGWGVPNFLARMTLKHRKLQLLPSDTLTITCRLKKEGHYLLQGGRFLSRASQTEDSDITVRIQNSHIEENSTVFDMKGATLLSDRMKDLLIRENDHDLEINVKTKVFRAHKNILRVRSPVFAMMFAHDGKESSTSTVNIEDCDPDAFGEFLLYVYSGKTENITPSNVFGLYYAADKYDFPDLKERCVSFLKTSLTKTSICDVILLAAKHLERELLEEATDFFIQNIDDILLTVEWQRFLVANPGEANELYIKSRKSWLHKS